MRPKSVIKTSISLWPSSSYSKSNAKYNQNDEASSNYSENAEVIASTILN